MRTGSERVRRMKKAFLSSCGPSRTSQSVGDSRTKRDPVPRMVCTSMGVNGVPGESAWDVGTYVSTNLQDAHTPTG